MASAAVASSNSSSSSSSSPNSTTIAIRDSDHDAMTARNDGNEEIGGETGKKTLNGQHEKSGGPVSSLSSVTAKDDRDRSDTTPSVRTTPKDNGGFTPNRQQHYRWMSSEATAPESSTGDGPLPRKLKQILQEVAKTGSCSWLLWDQENDSVSTGVSGIPEADDNQESVLQNPTVSGATAAGAATASLAVSSSWEHARASYATTRRPTQGPLSKKFRNGLYRGGATGATTANSSRMRFGNADGASSRKRPLLSTHSAAATAATAATTTSRGGGAGSIQSSAPSSVGSGRTSGSEPDDSTLYECDSEGTSATTNSEISVDRHRSRTTHPLKTAQLSGPPRAHTKTTEYNPSSWEDKSPYKTLQAAFRSALGLVLDHFYHFRGGYKLSPAEKRRNETMQVVEDGRQKDATTKNNNNNDDDDVEITNGKRPSPLSSEDVFLQRRQRLMMMMLPSSAHPESRKRPCSHNLLPKSDDAPFTIQRLAEVLIDPERYYTQTHKLCNCLEKLLLVTSSAEAFGGSTGGNTSQSRTEERELAALANEKRRQEMLERQKRFRRKTSSPTDELFTQNGSEGTTTANGNNTVDRHADTNIAHSSMKKVSNEGDHGNSSPDHTGTGPHSDKVALEKLEAARASLRSKFDHVGIDPHHSSPERDLRAIMERDLRAIMDDRRITNSPPPPGVSLSPTSPNIGLPGHSPVSGFHRTSSPGLFSSGNDPSHLTAASNMHMLQLHHAVSMAGGSLNRGNLDLTTIDTGPMSPTKGHEQPGSSGAYHPDLDRDQGRSSPSNSDVDSESDDISFDDSASDRSDRSDGSDSATHFEPFAAARAMALNRMQQQQRLQSRNLASLSSLQNNEGFRPAADSDYQSGDSIDSTRAEDSGGSDSSSSDLAD
ncbi:protein phosphatase 4 core regulatory subunit R2 [Nitzschia inconspicua]|uniref:Protein phosphatase 4 core regulatory subunit R2 n=1 Tax=Nitzschia inconspicua TaxID=303405 RepID=A0A9K3L3G8_9STRA|nr:protein phosphatase 4 core regulatory subunit R2 [Nitzschia inconspicua]